MKEKKNDVVENTTEQPKVDEKVEKLKIKKKPKKFSNNTDGDVTKVNLEELVKKTEDVIKVDLSKPKEDVKIEEEVIEKVTNKEPVNETSEETIEQTPLLEEITEEQEATKVIEPPKEIKNELPENIQKLVDFMNDTGGDIKDYVNLNTDYSKLDNDTLLREYYNKTKPHLNDEEINFLMEDNFSYDEDVDDAKDIQRKKLALKEQVADAKSHLDGLKSKYYEDIKYGSKLTSEQQKAIDFFNRYEKEAEDAKESSDHFLNKTKEVFNNDFKGFEYKVGDKKYRFNIKDSSKVRDNQSDINNFVRKFLDKDNKMQDATGYHKSLFTAMNSDAIANHFYEQGKADALKESIAKSKNVDMNPRQSHTGETQVGGYKFKVLGDNSDDFKFKIRKKSK